MTYKPHGRTITLSSRRGAPMQEFTPEEREAIEVAVAEAMQEQLPPLLARISSLSEQLSAACRDYQGAIGKMASNYSTN